MDWSGVDFSQVLAVLALLGVDSLLTLMVSSWINKKKREAEVTDLVTQAFKRLAEAQDAQIDDLKLELKDVKTEIEKKDNEAISMSNKIEALRDENKEKGEQIKKLEKDYEHLEKQYNELLERYQALERKYQELTGGA